MPRFNVRRPSDNMWATFSTISDGFITDWMGKEAYEAWRLQEYGRAGYEPAEKCNMMDYEEAMCRQREEYNSEG